MQGNIVSVYVDATQAALDRDLFLDPSFEVLTSRGNRYRVDREDDGSFTTVWTVTRTEANGILVSEPIGRVTGVRTLFTHRPASFRYRKDGSPLDSGNQGDLLNAVQSLTD